eukprot:3456423-Pleurochrysis_carterae.AAC.1
MERRGGEGGQRGRSGPWREASSEREGRMRGAGECNKVLGARCNEADRQAAGVHRVCVTDLWHHAELLARLSDRR